MYELLQYVPAAIFLLVIALAILAIMGILAPLPLQDRPRGPGQVPSPNGVLRNHHTGRRGPTHRQRHHTPLHNRNNRRHQH